MMSFRRAIDPHVDAELQAAWQAFGQVDRASSFGHLERAHVLGQASTYQHVRVHVHMLGWAWRTRSARELAGQMLRIVGAATKTPWGLVPDGNTGGANVSPFKPLSVPADLAQTIEQARRACAK